MSKDLCETVNRGGRRRPGRSLCGLDLQVAAGEVGIPPEAFAVTDLAAGQPLVTGKVRGCEIRPGLYVHCADVENLRDFPLQVDEVEGIHITLLLKGRVTVSFGAVPVTLACGSRNAVIVCLREPVRFVRHGRCGDHEGKVTITLGREWFARASELYARLQSGPAVACVHDWSPSPRALMLASELLYPQETDANLLPLYLEVRVTEIVSEALGHLATPGMRRPVQGGTGHLSPRQHLRMRALRDRLDADPHLSLSVAELARESGLSVSTLQRKFRAAFDVSVMAYVRQLRLERARMALEREGVSVQEAAGVAGYGCAENFATAFRRQYGCSPKQVLRARVSTSGG